MAGFCGWAEVGEVAMRVEYCVGFVRLSCGWLLSKQITGLLGLMALFSNLFLFPAFLLLFLLFFPVRNCIFYMIILGKSAVSYRLFFFLIDL